VADAIERRENFEPERYELREPPAYVFELNRREFAGVAGAGLLISVGLAKAQRGGGGGANPLESRLHIGEDGAVTIFTGKVEIGQGARVELAMAAAEEMRIPVEHVKMVMADTDLVPNDGITAGSRSTPSTVPAVRQAGAAARELLIGTAARRWSVGREGLQVRDGVVTKPGGGEKFDYAALAKSTELVSAYKQPPAGAALTPPPEWRVLGNSHHRLDGRAMVTGEHRFPSDVRRPGMLYGSVLRAPSYGATLADAVTTDAEKMPGVTVVREGTFAGCVAPSSFEARKAVAAIAAQSRWQTSDHPPSGRLFFYLKEKAVKEGQRGPRIQTTGSVEEGLSRAARKVRAAYEVPYIQHAPMEPRAAVAEWTDGKLTVWTGTQNPFGVRGQLAQAFHLPEDKVRVIMPDAGGGFGGKHTGEVAIEAARLAREAGRPVSLRWTRAEEFMWAYFRPAGLFEIEAGLDANGLITAWDFANYNAGTAAIATPYRIANTRTRFFYCDSPLREGSYRGIAATANNFARECFMDELAGARGADPLEFRLANLENARLRDVLQAAAKHFRWEERRKQRRAGRGVGLACGTEKGSYVAVCAEVQARREGGPPRILDLIMAFECGAILNPSNLKAQLEGCLIQGLGGALTEAIEFENGKLKNGSFKEYPVPRFRDVPPHEIVMVDRKDLAAAGGSETPIIGVAPAIANAAFAATGERVRSLPVKTKRATG
jgi:CO/xanthine dehydrogenase Mo-binding subunit